MEILKSKWALGFNDRGMGHGDFGVVTEGGNSHVVMKSEEYDGPGRVDFTDEDGNRIIIEPGGELVVACSSRELAEHIIRLHNEAEAKR